MIAAQTGACLLRGSRWSVSAVALAMTLVWSGVAVKAAAPPPPTITSATVNGSTVAIVWTAPAGSTSFAVDAGSVPGATNIVSVPIGGPSLTTSGVPAGTYYVRVRAINGDGSSGPSNEVTLTVGGCASAPGAPASLVGSVNGSSVSLGWGAAAGACAPTSYRLLAGTAPGASNLATLDVGATQSFSTAVPNGIYYVRVVAVNAAGASAPSNEVQVNVSAGCAGPPPAPSNLVANVSATTVVLSWAPPAPACGTTSYLVTAGFSPGSGAAAQLATTAPGLTVTAPLGVYYVRVLAVNAAGPSAGSNEVTVAVGSAPGSPPIDCALSPWSAWGNYSLSVCNASGQETLVEQRTRSVLTQPANGGLSCAAIGPLEEFRTSTRQCIAPGTLEVPRSTFTIGQTEEGYAVIFGEVQNRSTYTTGNTRVQTQFLDSARNIIATTETLIAGYPRRVAPGVIDDTTISPLDEPACFAVFTQISRAAVADATFTVIASVLQQAQLLRAADQVVPVGDPRLSENNGKLQIEGGLRNTSSLAIANTNVVFLARSTENKILSCDVVSVSPPQLSPGASASFSYITYAPYSQFSAERSKYWFRWNEPQQ